MVIIEMVKEFTSGEAFIAYAHQMKNFSSLVHLIDSGILREAFNDGEELLKYLMRFIQDFTHRAPALGFVNPCVDLILSL